MDKTRVLTITEQIIPSNAIGIIKPMLELQRNGEIEFSMRYAHSYKEKDIEWADTVILCRSIRPEDLNIIELVRKHGKKLIYDIDDNFFELSINNPLGRFHRHPAHLFVLEQMLKNADIVRVYSRPMEEICRRYNENVFRVKSYFDFSLIQDLQRTEHEKIKIVYATSRGRDDTLAQIYLPAVAKILKDFENQVEFYAFGQIPQQLKNFPNVHKLNYIPNYSKFISFFHQQSFDIGLAPLKDDRFHNSKTNNKFREYGAMGVCGIYSDAQIYRDCVVNRENGILVDETTQSWYQALKDLITDPELRKKIQKNAAETVARDYSMQNALETWREHLNAPIQHKGAYQNILRLKVALVHDDSVKYINVRENDLITLLGFCTIQHEHFQFYNDSLEKLKQYDVVIAFVGNAHKVEAWIKELKTYGAKNLIIDTMEPVEDAERYSDVMITNVIDYKAENGYPITFVSNYDSVNVLQAVVTEQLLHGDSDFCYVEGVRDAYAKIEDQNQKLFSLNSPMLLWANLLSRYQGTYYKAEFPFWIKAIRKVIHVASDMAVKVGRVFYKKVLAPIGNRILKVQQKVVRFARFWNDYILVNVFKKY